MRASTALQVVERSGLAVVDVPILPRHPVRRPTRTPPDPPQGRLVVRIVRAQRQGLLHEEEGCPEVAEVLPAARPQECDTIGGKRMRSIAKKLEDTLPVVVLSRCAEELVELIDFLLSELPGWR